MPEHLGDRLDRHALAQCHCSKGVACDVTGEVLVNVADGSDFLQILIHLLIGDDGEQMLFSALVIGILEDEPLGDVQQDYIYECACLNTTALDPFDAVERHDILTLQIGQVDIGKAGEAGEYEEVTDKRKALIANILVHEPVELIILKIAAVNTLQVETDVGERVVGHQSVANAKENDGFEGLERLGGSVGALADFRSQIKLEVMDDKRRDLGETEILTTVFFHYHVSEALADKLILAVRGGAESATAYLLLDILIVGLEQLHNRFGGDGFAQVILLDALEAQLVGLLVLII